MARTWKKVTTEEAVQNKLYGVKGWLAIFALGLLFGLILELGALNSGAHRADLSISEFLDLNLPIISLYKFSLFLHGAIVIAIYSLMLSKHPNFRKVSSALILGSWPLLALVASMIGGSEVTDALIRSLISWIVTAGVWVTYLNTSQRVRVTFEHCAALTPTPTDATEINKYISRTKVEASLRPDIEAQDGESASPSAATIQSPEIANKLASQPDESYWAEALGEFDGPNRRAGLWAKAFSESQGNESLAKAQYLRDRALQLRSVALEMASSQREASKSLVSDEIGRCISILTTLGYLVSTRTYGWEVKEPLGGRLKFKDLAAFSKYANERQ